MLNGRREFTNLEEVEVNMKLRPATQKDEEIINEYLDKEIMLYINNLNQVYTEAEIYIANMISIEE
jgi:hypothetical protein